jgi:hypothetical protein
MNYLVFVGARAGELERILSGVKCMVLKHFDPLRPDIAPVAPGDSLYFLRDNAERDLRVKATVVSVGVVKDSPAQELASTLKELQPKLQLDEFQFNHWSTRQHVWLVEFDSAHKIAVTRVAAEKVADRSDWMAFEDLSLIEDRSG